MFYPLMIICRKTWIVQLLATSESNPFMKTSTPPVNQHVS